MIGHALRRLQQTGLDLSRDFEGVVTKTSLTKKGHDLGHRTVSQETSATGIGEERRMQRASDQQAQTTDGGKQLIGRKLGKYPEPGIAADTAAWIFSSPS